MHEHTGHFHTGLGVLMKHNLLFRKEHAVFPFFLEANFPFRNLCRDARPQSTSLSLTSTLCKPGVSASWEMIGGNGLEVPW